MLFIMPRGQMLGQGFASGVMGCTRTGNTDEVTSRRRTASFHSGGTPGRGTGIRSLPSDRQQGALAARPPIFNPESVPVERVPSRQPSALLMGEPCTKAPLLSCLPTWPSSLRTQLGRCASRAGALRGALRGGWCTAVVCRARSRGEFGCSATAPLEWARQGTVPDVSRFG